MALIDPLLMEILVCPVDHADLREDVPASRLVCTDCGRRYPVEDGIPVMLVEEAEMPGQPATKGESNKEPSEDDSDVV